MPLPLPLVLVLVLALVLVLVLRWPLRWPLLAMCVGRHEQLLALTRPPRLHLHLHP